MSRFSPTTLEALLGARFAVEVAVPAIADEAELSPVERRYVERAVPKRRAEFATARKCARGALVRLGVDASMPLVPNPDRSPRWPQGIVGSITHTDGLCAVAVGRARPGLAVGIDAEVVEPLPLELYSTICTPDELEWLEGQASDSRGALAKLLFSAKEAVYKCQYPATRRTMEFTDVTLEVEPDAGRFGVRDGPGGATDRLERISGSFACSDGIIFCAAVIEG